MLGACRIDTERPSVEVRQKFATTGGCSLPPCREYLFVVLYIDGKSIKDENIKKFIFLFFGLIYFFYHHGSPSLNN